MKFNLMLNTAILLILAVMSPESRAQGWELQAERLQKVSASLLDAQPLLSPSEAASEKSVYRYELKSILSILPKMNSTIGAKKEDAPQPPIHTVPTVEGLYQFANSEWGTYFVRGWLGYLPGVMAKTMGMDASCTQAIYGAAVGVHTNLFSLVKIQSNLGIQKNRADIKGAITAKKSHDKFKVDTFLDFISVSMTPNDYPEFWGHIQVTERQITSHLQIPADGTSFTIEDESKISSQNPSTQLTIGYKINSEFQVAVAQLNVPQRVSMPRILLSYIPNRASNN